MKMIQQANLLMIVLIISITFQNCTKARSRKQEKFNFTISLDVENVEGPVILLDPSTWEAVNTVYSKEDRFILTGEISMDKMHAPFILHFASKHSNPYFYPLNKGVCN